MQDNNHKDYNNYKEGETHLNTLTAMLLIIINNSFQKDTNYYIALELIHSRDQIDSLSITALARSCQTSVASVNKFCKMLSIDSFSQLKYLLKSGFITRKQQMCFHLSKMDEESILSSIAYHAQTPFDKEAFKISIEHLVDIIKEAHAIQLIGAYFPTCLAVHFQEDMLNMDKFVYIHPQRVGIEADCNSEQELILAITLTGRIYGYNKKDFDALCQKHQNIVFISGFSDYPKYASIKSIVNIPIKEDNEIGNILILEVFRYIKYIYFHKYVKEFS